MNFPDQLKYTKDHEWIMVDGNIATVGITDFAQGELGDIVYVDITSAGETLSAETVFGTVEAVKTVSDLFMPVSGKVVEVNPHLESNPESVNKDPYGNGWMIKIEISNAPELEHLLSSAAYQQLVGAWSTNEHPTQEMVAAHCLGGGCFHCLCPTGAYSSCHYLLAMASLG